MNNLWREYLQVFPNWLITIQRKIPKPLYPRDRDVVIELLSVIASVTGVILALFYPVLATIASTAYAKVHASIRNILLSEKETQSYLRRLTYLTACSITVLLFVGFNFLPGNLILTFLTFYCLTVLFGILKIGFGVYRFFEPSTLSRIIFSKLSDSINNVTTNGQYWHDQNFQRHNHKIAVEQIENLSLIVSLCVKDDDLKESSFKAVFQTSVYALQYYLHQKAKIPVDSLWFPDTYYHKSYFQSDLTDRGISKSTYTFIRPDTVRNHFWLEERIITSLYTGLNSVNSSGNNAVLSETILMTQPLLVSLSKKIDTQTCETILKKLFSVLKDIGDNKKIDEKGSIYDDWKNELGCVQTYCYAILQFQIELFITIKQFDSTKVIQEYQKINWQKKESIYATSFIPDLYGSLNKFIDFINNEKYVEGKRITPDWYFQQSITAEYLDIISKKIISTVNLFNIYVLSLANHFDKKNYPLLSTFTAQLGLEILHKLNYQLNSLETTLVDLDKLERCKGEFRWNKPNLEQAALLISQYEKECFKLIKENFLKISEYKWTSDFPDIFAHSYALTISKLNKCFSDNNISEFKEIFPDYLKASLGAFNVINSNFSHLDNPQDISYQILLDLLEISGYSYIYSKVYKDPGYWKVVKDSWDKEFVPIVKNFETFARNYGYYRRVLLGGGVNYHEKHERQLTLSNVVTRLKLKQTDVDDIIVEPFVRDDLLIASYSVAELFFEIYLFTFVNAKSSTELFKRDFFNFWKWNINHPNARRNFRD